SVTLSGAKRSRRIPRYYLKGSATGPLDFARDDGAELIDQPNCKRIAIELSLAGLHRCNDDQHRVQHPKPDQDRNADENDTEDRRDGVIDQHRDLEIERFLSVGFDLRRVAAFHEPNDKRPQDVTQKVKKQSE